MDNITSYAKWIFTFHCLAKNEVDDTKVMESDSKTKMIL
jgi:hypothetical protein